MLDESVEKKETSGMGLLVFVCSGLASGGCETNDYMRYQQELLTLFGFEIIFQDDYLERSRATSTSIYTADDWRGLFQKNKHSFSHLLCDSNHFRSLKN